VFSSLHNVARPVPCREAEERCLVPIQVHVHDDDGSTILALAR